MTLVATTLDPNNKGSNITLSGGNLTATITSGSGNVRATRACPGLTYFEIATSGSYSGTPRVGISGPGGSLTNNLGADNYAVGYDSGGNVYLNGSSIATIATWSAGNTICVAIDTVNQNIWFKVGSGNWNNNATYSPASDTGGISYSAWATSNAMPAVGAAASAAFTMDFLSSSWTYSAPSGFSAISSVVPVCDALTQPGSLYNARLFTAGNVGSPLGNGVSVSGTVTQTGLNVAKTVRVYDNATGQLLETIVSNASTGAWSVLAHARAQVYVVAFDPTTYQAQVYDQVTPA